jgi:hypothetical protein
LSILWTELLATVLVAEARVINSTFVGNTLRVMGQDGSLAANANAQGAVEIVQVMHVKKALLTFRLKSTVFLLTPFDS